MLSIWKKYCSTCFTKHLFIIVILIALYSLAFAAQPVAPKSWLTEWPDTDFSIHNIDYTTVLSGGPPKDGIPAIDNPKFRPVSTITHIKETEPVITLFISGEARAYPLSILMFHEIVNDTVAGLPVAITYCPLCNSAIVFNRILKGKILDFGTTGKLRYSDMIMYDRQTESWWQQFIGKGIVGKYTGANLTQIPSKIESFALFKHHHPTGKVLTMPYRPLQQYGRNPYVNYDSSDWPFLFKGEYNGPVPALSRVIAIKNNAWPLALLREKKEIIYKDFILSWQPGQNSALDTPQINKGRDVGNVTVQRRKKNGVLKDIIYQTPFAFAFKAFYPKGVIHLK